MRVKIEKKRLILLNKKGIYPSTSLPEEAKFAQIVTLFTLLSLSSSSSFLLCLSLSDTFVSPLLLVHLLVLIYLCLYHISTIHSHLTSLLLWHLLLLTLEKDGGMNLLNCDLHYLGHFLINAADKAVAHYLIWM